MCLDIVFFGEALPDRFRECVQTVRKEIDAFIPFARIGFRES